MKKKIIALALVVVIIVSSFAVINFGILNFEEEPAKYTRPDFVTSDEVDETGLLVDVDYDDIESNLKKYNNTKDKDGDGVDDDYEEKMGYDPYNPDSDGDGLYDSEEPLYGTDVLNYDTDDDGLSDGEEVYNYSTNATLPDTDGDYLLDGEEVIAGTNPLVQDSDSDGLKDGEEEKWNEDTDEDGSINALDSDSDGDDLTDGKEVNLYSTNMLKADTDEDGIDDYRESTLYPTSPLLADTDYDGILDGEEAYDALYFEAEYFTSTGASSGYVDSVSVALPSEDTGDLIEINQNLDTGTYKLMIFSKITGYDSSKDQKPKLQVSMDGYQSKTETLYLPVVLDSINSVATEFTWVSTQPFVLPSYYSISFDINMIDYVADESIAIDKVAIVKLDPFDKSLTNPVDYDSDDDGILDGNEATEDAFWFEAEDYIFDEDYILRDYNASNGKLVSTTHLALASATTLIDTDIDAELPKGFYSLFIRGYSSWGSILDVAITYTDSNDNEATVTGKYEMDPNFKRGLWVAAYFNADSENLKMELPNPSSVNIKISVPDAMKAHPISIDKVLFVKMTYKKPTSAFASQLPGLVPRLLTNPMDPDTDGDQYRKEIVNENNECPACASLLSLTGYLTDGFELENGLNPMSLDTDSDFSDDDVDPNPLGEDADDDGIPDFFEDTYPEDMPDGIYQEDEENTNWCNPDTDRDRVIDGNEDWDYDTIVDDGETNPASPDTDGDGLLDGGKDLAPVLLEGKGYEYTTAVGSDQYDYLTSVLNKLNNSGELVDPWKISGGNAIFIGEVDKGTDPNDIDSDDDLISDGIEVFVYETNPAKEDTDGDSYNDYDEIFVLGTDPLVADYPDLTVKSLTLDPSVPEVDWWNQTVSGKFYIEIENIAKIDASGKIEIKLTSNGKTLRKTIRDLGAGQIKKVELDFEAVTEELFDFYNDPNVCAIIYPPGTHTATVKVETQNPNSYYGEKITESDYSNNQKEYEVLIKGAAPRAFLETNLCHPWIMAGENLTFSYKGNDPDGNIVKYEIDFEGDGMYDFTDTSEGSVTHTYDSSSYNGTERATFTAALKVTDNDNKTNMDYVDDISVSPSMDDDTDGDGLSNYDEIYVYGTNRDDADFDQDNLNDYQEIMIYKTDPFNHDSDGDGLRDDIEIVVAGFYGLNATQDADGDGLPNNLDADSDNDGIKDGRELSFARPDTYDPVEIQKLDVNNWRGTNPYFSDTDYDGISDTAEEGVAIWGANNRPHLYLNSIKEDSDGDGLSDYEEVYVYATASNKQDSDGDGLEDGADLQPLTDVVPMTILEEEFLHWAYTQSIDGENGVRWTKYYPTNMLQFDTKVRLCGIDGNSWDTWGEDEDLGNEGVMDSNPGPSSVWDLGFDDFEVYGYNYLNDDHTPFGLPYATMMTGARFNIRYQLRAVDYKLYLWNNKITKEPNNIYYTAWDIGLEEGYNNSIELQFKISDSRDKYDISNEENFYVPAFAYKLFTNGDDGLKFSTSGDKTSLIYKDYPVFEGIAQATEIKDKQHWYYAEIKISKEHISSENMFIVIQPVWLNANGQEYLNPNNLRFASMSKLVYYDDVNEKLRIGCRTFDELHNAISKPSTWDGERYNNYTSVRKINDSLYSVIEIESLKKAKKHEYRWDIFSPHTVLEKVISSKSYTVDSVDNFTGNLGTSKYANVVSVLSSAAPDSILATDYKFAMIKFPETDLVERDKKWYITSRTSDLLSDELAPMIFENTKHISFKANAVCAVVVGTADIIQSGVKYLNTNNRILERQYAEEMWAAGVNIGLNLIPYWFFVELGVKVIVYTIDWAIGWPDGVNVATLSDPGALIVFAVEYLICGDIPSDLAKKALRDACNILMNDVERMNLLRVEGEKFYVFIPPS